MLLTRPDITSDWRGDNLVFGESYLLVDCDTVIADYIDEIQAFLMTNYPDDVYNYKPHTKAEWLECLSDCTTTPEYHKPTDEGLINSDTQYYKEVAHERTNKDAKHHIA